MKTKLKYLLVLGLLCFAVGGCSRVGYQDKREQKSKIMLKAYSMSSAGDFDSAIALFNKALESYPTLARPHLDVALLLHDYTHDYIRAIYHYNRYLEMRPGSEKTAMIGERIKQAKRAFVADYMVKDKTAEGSLADLKTENLSLKNKNESLVKKIKALQVEIAGIDENVRQKYKESVVGEIKVSELKKSTKLPKSAPAVKPQKVTNNIVTNSSTVIPKKVKPPRVETVSKPPSAPPIEKQKVSSNDPGFNTYTVLPGDSLSKIAYKVYGDTTQWRRIQKSNRDFLGEKGVNVRPGQVLKVPVP